MSHLRVEQEQIDFLLREVVRGIFSSSSICEFGDLVAESLEHLLFFLGKIHVLLQPFLPLYDLLKKILRVWEVRPRTTCIAFNLNDADKSAEKSPHFMATAHGILDCFVAN
ncbi:hypothetical protein D3C76_956450 [compost metagenome]